MPAGGEFPHFAGMIRGIRPPQGPQSSRMDVEKGNLIRHVPEMSLKKIDGMSSRLALAVEPSILARAVDDGGWSLFLVRLELAGTSSSFLVPRPANTATHVFAPIQSGDSSHARRKCSRNVKSIPGGPQPLTGRLSQKRSIRVEAATHFATLALLRTLSQLALTAFTKRLPYARQRHPAASLDRCSIPRLPTLGASRPCRGQPSASVGAR